MSTNTFIKWSVYCTTDNKTVETLGYLPETDGVPLACPENNTHTIRVNSQKKIDTIYNNAVRILEETIQTGGNYRMESISLDVDANTTGTKNIIWPYDVSILSSRIQSEDIHKNDIMNLYVAPNTIIGTLTSDANIGDTVLNVSSSVLPILEVGYLITLTDGVNTEIVGDCINIDTENSQITISNPLTQSFSSSSPTYIQMSIHVLRNFELINSWLYVAGDDKIGGMGIPKNTPVSFTYQNNSTSGPAKHVSIIINYLY